MRKIFNSVVFILILIGLQQASYWLGLQKSTFADQKKLINRLDIDPSAFFYTESSQALEAEKRIRDLINEKISTEEQIDPSSAKNQK